MSIQNMLNDIAINMLPRIKQLILNTNHQNRNNIINITLHKIINSWIPLNDMTIDQIDAFEDEIMSTLKFYNYI